MNRSHIKELYFITYIDNLPSILKLGILSRNAAVRKKLNFKDVSEPGVQDRRAGKKIPGTSKALHDYANLYFDAHNPMLSARRSENNNICVLRINKNVLDLKGIVVTDMNAARDCRFMPLEEGLSSLDHDKIYMVHWKDPNNPINEYRQAGIKCAEILVPEYVESRYIIGAYVANHIALDAFIDLSIFKDKSEEVNTAFSRGEERSNTGLPSVFGKEKASKQIFDLEVSIKSGIFF